MVLPLPPSAVSLHQIPEPPLDFVGRSQEIADLCAARDAHKTNVLGLHGMPGVGKTSLAHKVAECISPTYPDAQLSLN